VRIAGPAGGGERYVLSADFAEQYRRHVAPIWRYVRARVENDADAEELTAEVFLRAYRDRDRFDPARGSTGAWLSGIARHVVTDWWRRRREVPMDELPEAGVAEDDPFAAAERSEGARTLHRHLARLNERERDALALRFGAELKAAEVGDVLGVSEPAARMVVHRAITKLRGVMEAG
jgi:RNA polymerase sigma factor (sigma-70 family)